jgi:hypothetical protein
MKFNLLELNWVGKISLRIGIENGEEDLTIAKVLEQDRKCKLVEL